jgi:hypothetical protein
MFQGNELPPFSCLKWVKLDKWQVVEKRGKGNSSPSMGMAIPILCGLFLLPLFSTTCHFPNLAHFDPEDDSTFLRHVDISLPNKTLSHPRRLQSYYSMP